jgi:hypothetical protein
MTTTLTEQEITEALDTLYEYEIMSQLFIDYQTNTEDN